MQVKFYRHSFFALNRAIEYELQGLLGDIPLFFTSNNPYDRCINSYRINYTWEGGLGLVPHIVETWRRDDVQPEVEAFFGCFDQQVFSSSFDAIQAELEASRPDSDRFLYHLLLLYNHFPRHPKLFIDGAIRRVLPMLGEAASIPAYAEVDLLWDDPDLAYHHYPWIKLVLRDRNSVPWRIPHADQEWLLLDQEDSSYNRIFVKPPMAPVQPSEYYPAYITYCKIVYEYLDPLFLRYPTQDGNVFEGDGFYKTIRPAEQPRKLIILPVYDSVFDEETLGHLTGHFMLVFPGDSSRKKFIADKLTAILPRLPLLADDLCAARTEHLLSQPVWDMGNPLLDFLQKLPLVQDWEQILVYDRRRSAFTRCFVRKESRDREEFSNNTRANPIEYREKMEVVNSHQGDLKYTLSDVAQQLSQMSDKLLDGVCIEVSGSPDRMLYCIDFALLTDRRIIPSIDEELVAQYRDLVLCFEYPRDTLFGKGDTGQRRNLAEKLGDRLYGYGTSDIRQVALKA